jgi:hypothetical protein
MHSSRSEGNLLPGEIPPSKIISMIRRSALSEAVVDMAQGLACRAVMKFPLVEALRRFRTTIHHWQLSTTEFVRIVGYFIRPSRHQNVRFHYHT